MTKEYDVPIHLVKIHGRLERAYGFVLDADLQGWSDLKEIMGVVQDIESYRSQIEGNPYMYEDMMDTPRLEKLEEKCKNFIKDNQKRLDNSKTN